MRAVNVWTVGRNLIVTWLVVTWCGGVEWDVLWLVSALGVWKVLV